MEQEEIERYLERLDCFLKYYETYPRRINANIPYIIRFANEITTELSGIDEATFKKFEDRLSSLYQKFIISYKDFIGHS